MQKDLAPFMSLFCHAPPPVAGTAAGMRNRYHQQMILKNFINDDVRKFVQNTPPKGEQTRSTGRKGGELPDGALNLEDECLRHPDIPTVPVRYLNKLVFGFGQQDDFHESVA